MKNRTLKFYVLLALPALLIVSSQLVPAFAQGTAFTYQGQLQNNGSLANGTYNLQFSLYTTNIGGTAVAGPVTNSAVAVTNGLFTVTIDFGSSVWSGQTNWLQIGVETNNGTSFTPLLPRQRVTPIPYAIAAESLNGTIPASQLTSIGNTNNSIANFFVGPAGNATTSGSYNTAEGVNALSSNITGQANTAVGEGALNDNTFGNNNTAIGIQALNDNTVGIDNTAIGFAALYFNTGGYYNTAIGAGALNANTTALDNTGVGIGTLNLDSVGPYNTACGAFALNSSTNSYNIGLGFNAGGNITTGSSNIDIGNLGLSTDNNIIRIGVGQTQTFIAGVIIGNGNGLTNVNAAQLASAGNTNGGVGNFFVGPSGNTTTSGSYNTANGAAALFDNTSGTGNTANGAQALYNNASGAYNAADGILALYSNTSGSQNAADGAETLLQNTSGSYNTANGFGALFDNTTGSNNIALGYIAGENITTGSSNIDIGNQGLATDTNIIRIGSGQTQTFIAGVIVGNGADLTNLNAAQLASIGNTSGGFGNFFSGPSGNATTSGSDNTANGYEALFFNTSGFGNTADGFSALNANTSGTDNTADGNVALGSTTSGSFNTADGAGALYYNTIGNFNTAIGDLALLNLGSSSGSGGGTNNIALGFYAGTAFTANESSNIDIGNTGVHGENNIIRIGTTQSATYLSGTVYANGVALTSDRNAKENFASINAQAVLDKVASLPITKWNYKTDKAAEHIGPMAQDFQAAFGLNGQDDKHISVVDEGGVTLAAIQGLNEKVEAEDENSQERIRKLEAENTDLREQLDELKQFVCQLSKKIGQSK